MESMDLVKQFMKAMARFRKMDYSVLHPGAGNGEFAALELISRHSRQCGALYGVYVSELLKVMDVSARRFRGFCGAWSKRGCACGRSTRRTGAAPACI